MRIEAIKTHLIIPGESLEALLDKYITDLVEHSVLAITSKIISIAQQRLINKASISKKDLVQKEADKYLKTMLPEHGFYLTIKDGRVIPSAGIDESNVSHDFYVLYPCYIQKTAHFLWQYLRQKHHVQNLGVLITDSNVTIMRRGVSGIGIGWCGFSPLHSYINEPDIQGNPLRVTQINMLDSLAASAVFVMGDGNEQTPLAFLTDIPRINFLDRPPTAEEENNVLMPIEEDLYGPLLTSDLWCI